MYTIYNLIAMYNKTLYHLLITKYIHTIYIYIYTHIIKIWNTFIF